MTDKLRYGVPALLLAVCLILGGCGKAADSENDAAKTSKPKSTASPTAESEEESVLGGNIGILFPGEENDELSAEAKQIRALLEEKDYEVETVYAEENEETQEKQIKKMIADKKNCIIVDAVSSKAVKEQIEQARKQGITVVAYDQIITGTDAVSCYVGFDNQSMGEAVASYIVDNCMLDSAKAEKRVSTLEFFMGDVEDQNGRMQLAGMMGVLQKYIDSNVLQIKSLRTAYDDMSIVRNSKDIAKETCSAIMKANYMDNPVDVVCVGSGGITGSIVRALKEQPGFEDDWPMVIGYGATKAAFKRLRSGHQDMLVCTWREGLPKLCADYVDNEIQGRETKNLKTCDNGTAEIPAVFGRMEIAYQDNYQQVMKNMGITIDEDK